MSEYKFTGWHWMLDSKGVMPQRLEPNAVRNNLKQACAKEKLTIIGIKEHHFNPQGYSCVMLLEESHISAHTYPEHGGIMIDLFTCGENFPGAAVDYLAAIYHADTTTVVKLQRGEG